MSNSHLPFFNEELKLLREEIRELKKCQIQYFALSVTGTGAILGFSDVPVALLAPLAIILPCWMIFFDKAHTITRIVGYMKILERNLEGSRDDIFIGFENALFKYREQESVIISHMKKKNTAKTKFTKTLIYYLKRSALIFMDIFTLSMRYRFWKLNWITFFCLSLICEIFFLIKTVNLRFYAFAPLLIIFICAIYTLRIMVALERGKYSYEKCTEIWEKVLEKK